VVGDRGSKGSSEHRRTAQASASQPTPDDPPEHLDKLAVGPRIRASYFDPFSTN